MGTGGRIAFGVASHNIHFAFGAFEQELEGVVGKGVVGVHKHHPIAFRNCHTGLSCGRNAVVFRVDYAYSAVIAVQFITKYAGAVGRAVIDQNQFKTAE